MTVLAIENIIGSASGHPNLIIYLGPDLDLDGVDSPITAANTLKVTRFNDSTGAVENYVPGGGSNDFTTLDAGYGKVHGRVYVIHAKASFVLDNCVPGEQVVEP